MSLGFGDYQKSYVGPARFVLPKVHQFPSKIDTLNGMTRSPVTMHIFSFFEEPISAHLFH